MSLYRCRGCDEEIQPGKPRIRCQQCEDYDICANCVVLELSSGGHQAEHQTVLYRASGFTTTTPSPRLHSPAGWPVLIEHDTFLETVAFNELMVVIFQCLDPERLGYLTPEAFSALCDLVGLPSSDNVWRRTMESGSGTVHEADAALRRYMECLCINHLLRPRAPTPPLWTSPPGLMPLATPLGITGVYLLECLTRPDRACDMLNILLQRYQPRVWRERGDVPRRALPPGPDPAFAREAAEARARLTGSPARPGTWLPRQITEARASLAALEVGAQHAVAPRQASPTKSHCARERAPVRVPVRLPVGDRRAAELRKAEAELLEMRRDMEMRRGRTRIDNELQYIEAQKRSHEDTLRSMERSMGVMRNIGQDRYYREEYYYE